jgi:hypothetical protein
MKHLLLILAIPISFFSYSQDAIPFETTTWDCNFHENGLLFTNTDQGSNGLLHKTLQASPLYSSNLWITTRDNNGQTFAAIGTYGPETDFIQGPYRDSSNYRPNSYIKITREEIENHMANFNSTGYIMPASIKNWPAIGDTAKGESLALAPFIDSNNNGCYDPENGDYPAVRGDFSLYMIYCTGVVPNVITGSDPVELEVHTMIYGFKDNPNPIINDAIFIRHSIYNPTSNYQYFQIGQYFDFDLGNPIDDFVGSDQKENSFYVYNGDNNDEETVLAPNFGENPAAFGVRFLNKPLYSAIYFDIGQHNMGWPATAPHYQNYMLGLKKDYTPITDPDNTPNKLMYSGDPVSATGWTEASSGNVPHDRRMIASFKNDEYFPSTRVHYDLAMYLGSGGSSNLDNISIMKHGLSIISTFFNNQNFINGVLATNSDCQVSGISANPKPAFKLFPNPTQGEISITSQQAIQSISILETGGKSTPVNFSPKGKIIIPKGISSGVYILVVSFQNGKKQYQKIALQR